MGECCAKHWSLNTSTRTKSNFARRTSAPPPHRRPTTRHSVKRKRRWLRSVCRRWVTSNSWSRVMSRVFIVGWDGATFDLIEPWVAEGKLPNIARLMKRGVHGRLRSTLPPMTFPAWSSFMTGKNPGKHGIFDFTRQKPGKYELEFVNGGLRRAPSFWNILSRAGRKVISISVPCTYPPEPVNGIMISGFDGPGQVGTSEVDARGMHPPELHQEIKEKLGGHPIGAFIANEINDGRPSAGLDRMLDAVRRKAATAKYLMQNKPWDCMMILF